MKVTLSHLLLLFPAFSLSYAIAFWIDPSPLAEHKHTIALVEARRLAIDIEAMDTELHRNGKARFKADVINAWLSGTIERNHPITKVLSVRCPDRDPWDQPYVFVHLSNSTRNIHTGIYSKGQDRISNSNGNDADDINSWNDYSDSFYSYAIASRQRRTTVLQAMTLTPLIYLGILMVIKRRKLKAAAK